MSTVGLMVGPNLVGSWSADTPASEVLQALHSCHGEDAALLLFDEVGMPVGYAVTNVEPKGGWDG